MKDKSVAEQTVDQMLLVYHELAPVQKAYDELLHALKRYNEKTHNWPPIHLGLAHYELAVEKIRTHRKEVLEASHVLRRTLVDDKRT